MKLNRERVAAGLALLLLIFGVYRMVGSRVSATLPPIPTEIPAYTQEIPRLEPRLFQRPGGASRNPFAVSSDWTAMTREDLPAPPLEASRWIVLPLGKSPDPDAVGYVFLEEPPAPASGEESSGEKARPAAGEGTKESGASGSGSGAEKTSKPAAAGSSRGTEPTAGAAVPGARKERRP